MGSSQVQDVHLQIVILLASHFGIYLIYLNLFHI